MKLDADKVNLLLAQNCATKKSLLEVISNDSIRKIQNGQDVTPKVCGKVALHFGVPVEDLLAR